MFRHSTSGKTCILATFPVPSGMVDRLGHRIVPGYNGNPERRDSAGIQRPCRNPETLPELLRADLKPRLSP